LQTHTSTHWTICQLLKCATQALWRLQASLNQFKHCSHHLTDSLTIFYQLTAKSIKRKLHFSTLWSEKNWQQKLNETTINNINEKLIDSMLLRIKKSSNTKSKLFDSSQSSPEHLSKVNNYVLMIKKLKHKKQIMNWLNVNWDWSWDRFADKISLKKEINA